MHWNANCPAKPEMEGEITSNRKLGGMVAVGSILLGVVMMNMHDIVRYVRISRM